MQSVNPNETQVISPAETLIASASASNVGKGVSIQDIRAVANENEKYIQRCAISIAMLFAVGALLIAIMQRYVDTASSHVIRYVFFAAVDLVLIGSVYRLMLSRQSRSVPVIEELAQEGSLSSVEILIEALNIEDQAIRIAVSDALINSLPNLHLLPEAKLTEKSLSILCGVLDRDPVDTSPGTKPDHNKSESVKASAIKPDLQLRCSILKAMEYLGDQSCLTSVRRLSELNGNTREEILLKDWALRCLPTLVMVSLREAEKAADALELSSREAAASTNEDILTKQVEPIEVIPVDTKSLLLSDMDRMD